MRFTDETKRRAIRTFIQVFIPAFLIGLDEIFREDGSITWGVVIGIALPAIASGIAAIMNLEKGEIDDVYDMEVYDNEDIEAETNDI